jgi:RNA polymerase sigma-70 factor (ECF subfamily)
MRTLMPTEAMNATRKVAWGRQIEAIATERDRASFIALFQHFAPRVKTFMIRSGASEATAEEIAQETMLTVWRKADLFISGSHGAAAWIFTIARNLRIDALRREQRGGSASERASDNDNTRAVELTPEAQFAAAQSEENVRNAMAQLSDEQMQVIEQFFFEEKTHSEIADHLKIPLGTVKSRLRLAIARLRALLEQAS